MGKRLPRRYYSEADKALMWNRWLQGDSLHAIARLLDTSHTSIRRHLVATGGIRPLPRKRSNLALSLSEREEISRGIVAGRTIAPTGPIRRHGIGHVVPSAVNWSPTRSWLALWRVSSRCSGHPSRSPVG